MDTERSRRHASKLLTYPITIGGALHQHSGMTLNNQRVTPEGSRSLAGKFVVIHLKFFLKHFFSHKKHTACTYWCTRN